MFNMYQPSFRENSYFKVKTTDRHHYDEYRRRRRGSVDEKRGDDDRRAGDEGVPDRASVIATMKRLLEMGRPERHLMVLSGITMALSSVVSLTVPTYSAKIIDLAIAAHNESTNNTDEASSATGVVAAADAASSYRLLTELFGLMAASSVCGFLRGAWQARAGHRLVARLRRRLYAAVLSQDAAFFDAASVGDLLSRLSSDADLVQSAATDNVLTALRGATVGVGAAAALFATSARLALVSVSVLPPVAVGARAVGRRLRERQRSVREHHAAATARAERAVAGVVAVKQFTAEARETAAYAEDVRRAHAEDVRNATARALFRSGVGLFSNAALLCVLGYGGALVTRGRLSPGDLAGFVMYSIMMATNVSAVSSQYVALTKAVAAADRVFEIVDSEPTIPAPYLPPPEEYHETLAEPPPKDDDDDDVDASANNVVDEEDETSALEMHRVGRDVEDDRPAVVPLSVEFESVHFSYPTRPDAPVLRDFSLSIAAGEVVALVGESGAGKSTVAALLTRLYDPDAGVVRLDGVALPDRGDPASAVRAVVGVVAQEPTLFPDTVEANVRYGAPRASAADLRRAVDAARVDAFADALPDGLATEVGPRGTQLSGGQRQRVAVARCLIKDPPVVVLDEATSALDAENEARVQTAVDAACRGRTVLLIAHRLSTIRNADRVVVLEGGRVVEDGPVEELLRRTTPTKGAFRTLMEKQLVT